MFVYCSTSHGTLGRGPITLISPCRIFQSWGNSSRLELRRNRPTRVMYADLVDLNVALPSLLIFGSTRPITKSAMYFRSSRQSWLLNIVRNLYIRKGRPSLP